MKCRELVRSIHINDYVILTVGEKLSQIGGNLGMRNSESGHTRKVSAKKSLNLQRKYEERSSNLQSQ